MAAVDELFMVANPISGSGRGLEVAERLHNALRAAGYSVTLLFTPADAKQLAACFTRRDTRCGIVIGGDGTVRSVVAAMIAHGPMDALPPLLIVPMGTANLLGLHLGLRWSQRDLEQEVIAAVRKPRICRLDAATANGQPFLIVGGVGLDAAVVHELDRVRKGPIDKLSYLKPAFKALLRHEFPRLTVTVDGRVLGRGVRGMAFIGNIREYGTGFAVLPQARPDDGLLDVCLLPCSDVPQAIGMFMRACVGEHLQAEGVRYAKGRQIMIESDEPTPLQIDGEAAGFTPVRIELLPHRVPFVVGNAGG